VVSQSDKWNSISSTFHGVSSACSAAVGNRIYVFGGLEKGSMIPLSMAQVYNPVFNSWNQTTSLPISIYSCSASSYDGLIYIVGGFSNGLVASDKFLQFDPTSQAYTFLTSVPTPRGALTSNWLGGQLYAIGGSNGADSLGTVEVYNPSSNRWSSKTDMPIPRDHHASGVINGNIYIIGGRNPYPLNSTSQYSPNYGWLERATMPTNRSSCAAVVYSNRVFVFGGEGTDLLSGGSSNDNGIKLYGKNEEYDPINDFWKCRSSMPTSRSELNVVISGNYIYAIGGVADDGPTSVIDAYSPADAAAIGECPPPVSSSNYLRSTSTITMATIISIAIFFM